MRYVRLSQGKGITRPRIPIFEGAGSAGIGGGEVMEKRGAMLFVEPGARGGTFVGVYFDNDEANQKVSQSIIRRRNVG